MSLFKSLFKQTAIYGLATVLPRMFSFILVPLHIKYLHNQESYGELSIIFSYIIFFNVILSYGMETAFFRFYNNDNKTKVISTATLSLFWTSIIFLITSLLFRNKIAEWTGIEVQYINLTIWILTLDALVIIPFAKLRAMQKPAAYAIIKVGSVALYFFLNLFFLKYLPQYHNADPNSFIASFYNEDFNVGYVFLANVIASLATLIVLLPSYFTVKWEFDIILWKRMIKYAIPVMIAGIAFAINEAFDRLLLDYILPENIAKSEIGAYSGCYKMAIFMVLYATAFRLGIEPFFFNYSKNKDAKQTYAIITKYFIIFGSFIMLGVIVFADVLKVFLIPNSNFWEAMKVVPLIIAANFFLGIYHNLSVWYKLTDKTKMGAYISITGAVITLALNFTLIPVLSYMGSAIATVAAYSSMMVISYYLGNRHYPIPYDLKKIGLYLGGSLLLSGLYFYLFRENYYIGVTILIIYAVLIYKNEKSFLLKIIRKA